MRRFVVLVPIVCLACDPSAEAPDAFASIDAASVVDAGTNVDATSGLDVGAPIDAGVPVDTASSVDASSVADAFDEPDAFAPADAFVEPDAFTSPDAFTPPDAIVPADAFAARADLHVHIEVDNTCRMAVTPREVSVPPGQTLYLDWHNHSRDYPVDVWMSYGGGYTDLAPGATWDEPIGHCSTPFVGDEYADISTACSEFRFLIHCR